jgi:hypothetical protein
VKTCEQGGERGYDAGKKIKGRKRHIIVDCLGGSGAKINLGKKIVFPSYFLWN